MAEVIQNKMRNLQQPVINDINVRFDGMELFQLILHLKFTEILFLYILLLYIHFNQLSFLLLNLIFFNRIVH